MADGGADFVQKITADPSGFVKGWDQAKSAASNASKDIDSQFKKIGDTINNVNKYMMGFVTVLAGGGALKKFISDANEWNGSAGKMAGQLGITTEKASVLNTALTRMGMDSDLYMRAAVELTKKTQENGAAFDTLGVKLKDASGNYRPVGELMSDVNTKLSAIKNPMEQNIAGMKVYGEGWNEIKGVLKINAQAMQDAEARARELGLIVGPEGVAMSKQYSAQMKELNLVGKSIEVQFGNQLLPVFTTLGGFMAQEGPIAGQTFGLILKGIGFAAASTWLALRDMGDGIGAIAAQGAALLSGDLAAYKAIGAERDAQAQKNEAAYERLKAQFAAPFAAPKLPDDPSTTGGPHYKFGKEGADAGAGADKSRMSEWEAKLATDKAALTRQGLQEDQYREMSRAKELAYWADLKSRRDLTAAERIALERKTADIELASIKDQFDQRIAALQTEAAAYKTNTDAKLAIEQQIQAKYQQGTKEYEAAAKRIVEIQKQAAEQQAQIALVRTQAERDARLQAVDLETQAAELAQQAGEISQVQLLAMQADFERRRYAIAAEALQERLALAEKDPDKNPVLVAQLNAQAEDLERQHQLKMRQVQGQSTLAAQADWRGMIDNMQSGWANSIKGMLSGTQTLSQGLRGMLSGVLDAFLGMIAQMAAKWLATQLMMLVFGKTMAGSEVSAEAAKAGAGGIASMAAAPFPLNLTAPAFGAAMSAAALAFAPMASAAGGYDIPGTLNPITQLHAREMVLPAKYADVIRNVADSNGVAGGAGGSSAQAAAAQAEPTSIRGMPPGDWLMLHKGDLVKALASANRSFAIVRGR